jgi:predicted HD superfamily hydrolase involved in NAD metabolism
MEAAELARLLECQLDSRLSPRRAAHSRSVASLAAELCRARSIDPERGRAAGLAHDYCRELPFAAQRELARLYLGPCPDSARESEHAAHGPAAAALLADRHGVEDGELLDAVASHTLGRLAMGELSIILFCADKLEPGRAHVPPKLRESMAGLEPRAMLLSVLSNSLDWLRSRGRSIAPETLLLYTHLTESGSAE